MSYEIVLMTREYVVIHDLDVGMSVTNEAEKVVAQVDRQVDLRSKRLFYRDTDGNYDELLHTDGVFRDFGLVDHETKGMFLAKLDVLAKLDGS